MFLYPKNIDPGSYVIWKVGEPGHNVDTHKQTMHDISHIVSGQGTFILNNTVYPVRKGDVFIDRISDTHTVISCTFDPLRYQYMWEGISRSRAFGRHPPHPGFSEQFHHPAHLAGVQHR